MSPDTRRYLVVAALVAVLGALPALGMRWRESQAVQAWPTPAPTTFASIASPAHTAILDVEGWYRVSPHESAAATPYDFTFESGLKGIPMRIGEWSATEAPLEREVVEWFDSPEVYLRRLYRRPDGAALWLSLFGSKGNKSFHLFEHTPATSYPAAGWTLLREEVAATPVEGGAINTQAVYLKKDSEQRLALYWYMWTGPQRDADAGVLSCRLHVPYVNNSAHDTLKAAQEFLRQVFPRALNWRRF